MSEGPGPINWGNIQFFRFTTDRNSNSKPGSKRAPIVVFDSSDSEDERPSEVKKNKPAAVPAEAPDYDSEDDRPFQVKRKKPAAVPAEAPDYDSEDDEPFQVRGKSRLRPRLRPRRGNCGPGYPAGCTVPEPKKGYIIWY